jgi:hypothetical protein
MMMLNMEKFYYVCRELILYLENRLDSLETNWHGKLFLVKLMNEFSGLLKLWEFYGWLGIFHTIFLIGFWIENFSWNMKSQESFINFKLDQKSNIWDLCGQLGQEETSISIIFWIALRGFLQHRNFLHHSIQMQILVLKLINPAFVNFKMKNES